MGREAGTFQFGDWIIEPQLNRLRRADADDSRLLAPKAMDLLVCLLERPAEVLSPDDLIELVWNGRLVEESSIHQRISQIRRALGDDRKQPTYIENVPRRGYRTLARIRRLTAAKPDGRPAARKVAIRTLRNLTPDGGMDWLARGLTEHLRRQVDLWRGFTVLPGSLLDVDGNQPLRDAELLLDGFVQQHDRRVVVHLELIDVLRKSTIWAERFEGGHEDPYELQRGIAVSIARFFGESLNLAQAPSVPEAYGPYLRVMAVASYVSYETHLHWLNRTLELDPDWSWGWADLAYLLLRSGITTRDMSLGEQARAILDEKPRIDASRAYFTLVESKLAAYWDGDLDRGERLAAELAANGLSWPYGILMLSSGLHQEAEAYFRYQTEFHPYQPVGWEMLMESRLNLGDAQGALAAGRQLCRLHQPDSINSMTLIAWALTRAGELDEAGEVITRVTEKAALLPDCIQRRMTDRVLLRTEFEFAMMAGDRSSATAAIDRMIDLGLRTLPGILCLRIGDPRAGSLLATAPQPHFDRFWWWKTVSQITPEIADHPEIERVRRELGFTREWRYELAQRAARLPAGSHISSDAGNYAV